MLERIFGSTRVTVNEPEAAASLERERPVEGASELAEPSLPPTVVSEVAASRPDLNREAWEQFDERLRRLEERVASIEAGQPSVSTGAPPRSLSAQRRARAFWQRWLFTDLFAEIGTIFRMYFDRSYPMSWTGRMAPIVLLVFLVGSEFFTAFFFPVPIVGPIFRKISDLIIAFIVYKVLSREAARYRETMEE